MCLSIFFFLFGFAMHEMQRAFHLSPVSYAGSCPGRMWVLAMFCNVSDSPQAHSSAAADQRVSS